MLRIVKVWIQFFSSSVLCALTPMSSTIHFISILKSMSSCFFLNLKYFFLLFIYSINNFRWLPPGITYYYNYHNSSCMFFTPVLFGDFSLISRTLLSIRADFDSAQYFLLFPVHQVAFLDLWKVLQVLKLQLVSELLLWSTTFFRSWQGLSMCPIFRFLFVRQNPLSSVHAGVISRTFNNLRTILMAENKKI